ncbi:IMP 5'-nucleotidase [Sorochytrium milnesiophthora]
MANSAYRINYFLRSHKRDVFIEFVKSAVHVPFALHARPLTPEQLLAWTAVSGHQSAGEQVSSEAVDKHNAEFLRSEYLKVLETLELLIAEHIAQQDHPDPSSRLISLVPTVGKFFTPLPLRAAFMEYDATFGISGRRHIPISFNEIRCILNVAQVLAIGKQLKLITFDGDMTLYDDGANFGADSQLVQLLIELLRAPGVNVAIVTAAGYTEAERYEMRLRGLLDGFKAAQLEKDVVGKFWVMGGECNYLFRCSADYHLIPIPLTYKPEAFHHFQQVRISRHNSVTGSLPQLANDDTRLASPALAHTDPAPALPIVSSMALATSAKQHHGRSAAKDPASVNATTLVEAVNARSGETPSVGDANTDIYTAEEVSTLLDVAQHVLEQCQKSMGMATKIVRKQRAVGIISGDASVRLSRELLDECVLSVQHALNLYLRHRYVHAADSAGAAAKAPLPFCAFNGGQDVWVDIGNKLIGVMILQDFLAVQSGETLHVGDQLTRRVDKFLSTGNDYAARRACSTVWITNPQETADILKQLRKVMQ